MNAQNVPGTEFDGFAHGMLPKLKDLSFDMIPMSKLFPEYSGNKVFLFCCRTFSGYKI